MLLYLMYLQGCTAFFFFLMYSIQTILFNKKNYMLWQQTLMAIYFFIFFFLFYFIFMNSINTFVLYNTNKSYEFIIYLYVWALVYMFGTMTFISLTFTMLFHITEFYFFGSFFFLICLGSQILIFTDNMIFFFLGYEMLLLPAFYILYLYSKSYRGVEAAYMMLFWTQFGAFNMMLILMYIVLNFKIYNFSELMYVNLTNNEMNFMMFFALMGFGVKMPIWPFYGWLPKAHVEAPTNFSIFLSGVLVKFAFFGFFKILVTTQQDLQLQFLYLWINVGIIEVSQKLFYQTDLKRLIALTTVIEMHWVLLSMFNLTGLGIYSGLLMLSSHAIISSIFFLLTDCIARRYKTRLMYEMSGLWWNAPILNSLMLITNLMFLGFPYTSFFLAEYLFLILLMDLNPMNFVLVYFLIYVMNPMIIFSAWVNILYGKTMMTTEFKMMDCTQTEFFLILMLIFQLMFLGFYPIWNIY